MSKICIGIISYLPDDPVSREVRKSRALSLIRQCDNWFRIPIIVIAQNWSSDMLISTNNSNLIIYSYSNKLGITNARLTLVEKFKKSPYDRIIFMDDDMILNSEFEVRKYLNSLGNKSFYYVSGWLCNFCSISKDGLNVVNFDREVDAEKQTGFEDWLFFRTCLKKLSNEKIICNVGKGTRKDYLDDKYSTWNPNGINNKNRNTKITSDKILKIR